MNHLNVINKLINHDAITEKFCKFKDDVELDGLKFEPGFVQPKQSNSKIPKISTTSVTNYQWISLAAFCIFTMNSVSQCSTTLAIFIQPLTELQNTLLN